MDGLAAGWVECVETDKLEKTEYIFDLQSKSMTNDASNNFEI